MQFAKELMTEAGITDAEQQKQLEALFGNDKVKTKLGGVLSEATEGIARERGRVDVATKQVKEKDEAMQKYYAEQLALAARNKAAVDEATAQVARYVELYGELPGGGAPTRAATAAAVQDVIDKKTFDSRLATTEQNTVGLAKSIMKITAKHLREFPEVELDPDAIADVAQKQGLTAEKAWEVWTEPQRQAKQAAKFEAEKQAAIDAAVIEANSKHGVTQAVDAAPRSEFMQGLTKQTAPQTGFEGFKSGWRDPNAAETMKKEFGPR